MKLKTLLTENHGEAFDYEWGKGVTIGGSNPSDLTFYFDKKSKNLCYSYKNVSGTLSDADLNLLVGFLRPYIQ